MRRCFALVELWSHIYFTPTKKERLLIFDLNRKCGKSYRVSGLVQSFIYYNSCVFYDLLFRCFYITLFCYFEVTLVCLVPCGLVARRMVSHHVNAVGNNGTHCPDVCHITAGLRLQHDIADGRTLLRTCQHLNAHCIGRKLVEVLVEAASANDVQYTWNTGDTGVSSTRPFP